jgi:hypothetical protein
MWDNSGNLDNAKTALFEALLLPILIPAFVWLLGQQDVFLLQTAFPWLILIPTLAASRYGTWYGLLSLLIFSILCLLYVSQFQSYLLHNAIQMLIGSLLLVVLVGEITQRWEKINHQQREQLKDCHQSTSQSEQALQLLHISYSQLEEEMVTTTQSLAGSLRLLEISLEQPRGRKERLLLAIRKMKSILQQYEWLEAAAFYHINKEGILRPTPIGTIGVIPDDLHNDPLIAEVIKSKKSIRLKQKSSSSDFTSSQLQAAIPLIDNSQHLWGVLAVNRMASSTFVQQNLNLLALLSSYAANLLSNAQRPISGKKLLFSEISTAVEVVLNTVKSVTLMTVKIPASPQEQEYQTFFASKVRGANRIWRLQKEHGISAIILLPLFNADNTTQWQKNLENTFIKQLGANFNEANIKFSSLHFHKKANQSTLKNYLNHTSEFKHAHLIR